MQNDGGATVSERLEHEFRQQYGAAPRWIARAPGRVNLIGEHTDYNDGFVLPMAIERYTTVAAAPNGSNTVVLCSTAADEIARIDLGSSLEPEPDRCWSNYPRGVVAGFIRAGYRLDGMDVLIESTVPIGGGLSSSAALEVALATMLEAAVGETLDPRRKALLCRSAEHTYAGVPCGIMDQFICTLAREGNLLLLDCRSQQTEWIAMSDPSVSVLIINTNIKHQLAGSEYSVRRSQCEQAAAILGTASLREVTQKQLEKMRDKMDRTIYRRARHVIGENLRTIRAARAIPRRDWPEVGQLMYASHESLKTDYEVSCPELDAVVEIAQGIGIEGGVFGCRMTGCGFGGCAVALIETQAQKSISRTVTDNYKTGTGIEPALFVSRPAQGAMLLQRTGANAGRRLDVR